jgi:hypothetical protein
MSELLISPDSPLPTDTDECGLVNDMALALALARVHAKLIDGHAHVPIRWDTLQSPGQSAGARP